MLRVRESDNKSPLLAEDGPYRRMYYGGEE
jgi:hypothetical protein